LTRPQREFDAEFMLERAGVSVLVPFKVEYRRPNRFVKAKREVRYPLMRGYAFAGFETPTPPWYTVLTTFRDVLRGVIGHNGEPYRFQPGVIAALAEMSASKAPMPWRRMRTHHEFDVGDDVTILDGPYQDFTVSVEEISGKHAQVLISIFGDTFSAEIDLWRLAKAS
jgi:transcription antitermination factor NusG